MTQDSSETGLADRNRSTTPNTLNTTSVTTTSVVTVGQHDE